jgi:hypothetical protein
LVDDAAFHENDDKRHPHQDGYTNIIEAADVEQAVEQLSK